MKRNLSVMIMLFVIHCSNAQSYFKNKEEISKSSDRIMLNLKNKEFQKAFEELGKYWPLPENELEQLETQTIKQFNMVADRFGNMIGTDFIKDQTVKDFVLRKTYVIRCERHMIRVLFTYYRNDQGWVLNGFKWDDNFEELYD